MISLKHKRWQRYGRTQNATQRTHNSSWKLPTSAKILTIAIPIFLFLCSPSDARLIGLNEDRGEAGGSLGRAHWRGVVVAIFAFLLITFGGDFCSVEHRSPCIISTQCCSTNMEVIVLFGASAFDASDFRAAHDLA